MKKSIYNIVHQKDDKIFLTNFFNNKSVCLSNLNPFYIDFFSSDCKNVKELKNSQLWMYKHGFVIDDSIDEFLEINKKYTTFFEQENELEITLVVTGNCNFKCKYCYQNHKKENTLCTSKIDGLINYIEKKGPNLKRLKIHWFGGEPLLELKKILITMEKINKIALKHRIAVIGHITTNGYDLSLDNFIMLLNQKIIFFQVTIDGNEEIHNYLRPHKKNKESYAKIIENLSEISKNCKRYYGITIRINMTNDFFINFEENIRNYKLFFKNNNISFNLQRVSNYGGDNILNISDKLLKKSEYEFLLNKMRVNGFKINNQMYNTLGAGLCTASKKNSFYINYNGDIVKCSLAIYDESLAEKNKIGNITDNGNIEFYDKSHNLWLNRSYLDEECKKCKLFPICMGNTCPYVKIKYNKKNFRTC